MPRKRKGPGGRRKGAGRPPLGDAARSSVIRVRTTPAVAQQVADAAASEKRSVSDWGAAAFDLALARAKREGVI